MIGKSPQEVSARLRGWIERVDRRHPETQRCYFSDDVEIVVAFKDQKAAGIAVISRRPDTPLARLEELRKLVGSGGKSSSEWGCTGFSFGPVHWPPKKGGSIPLPKKPRKKR